MYQPSYPTISHKFPSTAAHISAKLFQLYMGQIFLIILIKEMSEEIFGEISAALHGD